MTITLDELVRYPSNFGRPFSGSSSGGLSGPAWLECYFFAGLEGHQRPRRKHKRRVCGHRRCHGPVGITAVPGTATISPLAAGGVLPIPGRLRLLKKD